MVLSEYRNTAPHSDADGMRNGGGPASRPGIFAAMAALILAMALSCSPERYSYKGGLKLHDHAWLRERRIFIDPGHGGLGKSDPSRMGPGGITEEEVNLRVGLILEEMLKGAGARVRMSRRIDADIPLDARIKDAGDFRPELLVSIHHNNSARKEDGVNYPFVFIWGSREVKPESYDFASYLQEELNRIMETPGHVLSDFSVYSETGTRILRETRYLCPGVLGEAGFFTDPVHSLRLRDLQYNEREAEAYFSAISLYFKRGIPTAEVVISCPVENDKSYVNLIRERRPRIAIVIQSGGEKKGIEPGSLKVTLNNLPVGTTRITDEIYRIDYGRTLYPGGNSFRFQFRNHRSQSSMIYNVPILVEVKKGEYRSLINEGRKLLHGGTQIREGLQMLLAAYSMEKTDPGIDAVMYDIARGFSLLGDLANAEYFLSRLHFFYPQSKAAAGKAPAIRNSLGYRYPVEFHGKRAELTGEADIDRFLKDFPDTTAEKWLQETKKRFQEKKGAVK